MAKHTFTILCESAINDSIRNTISLMNIVEEIVVTPTPPANQHSNIVISWTLVISAIRDNLSIPETQNVRVDIQFPDGTSNTGSTAVLDLQTTHRARAFISIQGMAIKGIGDHSFVVLFDDTSGVWQPVAEWRFMVS